MKKQPVNPEHHEGSGPFDYHELEPAENLSKGILTCGLLLAGFTLAVIGFIWWLVS